MQEWREKKDGDKAKTQMVKQSNCFDVQLKIERKLENEDCELIEEDWEFF